MTKTFVDDNQHVRRSEVVYKNLQDVKVASQYKSNPYTTIERAVQKLVVILQIENYTDDDAQWLPQIEPMWGVFNVIILFYTIQNELVQFNGVCWVNID